jgi:hypothetical protein
MNSTLIRSAAAALLMVVAAPSFAADKGGANAPQPQSGDESAKKYCLSSSQLPTPVTTGTIIPQPLRQCLTRDQWAAKGVSFRVK